MLQTRSDSGLWFNKSAGPPRGSWDDEDNARRNSNRSGKVRILVVDDEPTITDTLVEILNSEGFEATAASAGKPALECAHSFAPDVVISDVIMPDINGVQLGIQIREILPQCRVILFSGQTATVDLLKEARQHGHEFEIVAKPIKPQRLLSIIRSGNTN